MKKSTIDKVINQQILERLDVEEPIENKYRRLLAEGMLENQRQNTMLKTNELSHFAKITDYWLFRLFNRTK